MKCPTSYFHYLFNYFDFLPLACLSDEYAQFQWQSRGLHVCVLLLCPKHILLTTLKLKKRIVSFVSLNLFNYLV